MYSKQLHNRRLILNFIELQDSLEKLTNKKITQSEIARMLGVGRANIHDRIKRNSSVTTDEIETIQNKLNINFFMYLDEEVNNNSKALKFDSTIPDRFKNFGKRLLMLQEKNNFSNLQMSGLLNIKENEYNNILKGKTNPDIDLINNIKQHFQVSVDWLLYGD